ncbi:hypothetical protein, partial [Mesorhizobium sp.]
MKVTVGVPSTRLERAALGYRIFRLIHAAKLEFQRDGLTLDRDTDSEDCGAAAFAPALASMLA